MSLAKVGEPNDPAQRAAGVAIWRGEFLCRGCRQHSGWLVCSDNEQDAARRVEAAAATSGEKGCLLANCPQAERYRNKQKRKGV